MHTYTQKTMRYSHIQASTPMYRLHMNVHESPTLINHNLILILDRTSTWSREAQCSFTFIHAESPIAPTLAASEGPPLSYHHANRHHQLGLPHLIVYGMMMRRRRAGTELMWVVAPFGCMEEARRPYMSIVYGAPTRQSTMAILAPSPEHC